MIVIQSQICIINKYLSGYISLLTFNRHIFELNPKKAVLTIVKTIITTHNVSHYYSAS